MSPLRKTINFITLGCDKNRVDTEKLLARLRRAGFSISPPGRSAFALIINTCGFIEEAKRESVEAIIAGAGAKEEGDYEVLAVVGCLGERYRDELARELPEADFILGLEHVERLPSLLEREWEKRKGPAGWKDRKPRRPKLKPCSRLLTTPSHYSFLKIAEGCDLACRFCAIPGIRGPYRSEPLEALIDEAVELERQGVKELNLVAQETTGWGRDLNPRGELSDLLEALLARTRIPWLRILYAHPARISDRLIKLLAQEPRLLAYLDLPLQHISDRMLAKMGRKPGRKKLLSLLERLYQDIPGLVLRTTFLVGFPGETEKDFQELLHFVEEGWFFWASGFVFSPEEGTPAAKMRPKVPKEIASERLDQLLFAQGEVTARKLKALEGRTLEVLVEEPYPGFEKKERPEGSGSHTTKKSRKPREPEAWLARFRGQAPEVDGVVRLRGPAAPGRMVKARVIAAGDYDLEVLRE